MSGHSKWSTIKRQKGVADIKRGQMFTKISRAISLAVREGGGIADSTSNFKLRLAVDKAKEMNMPKENIKRAIDRGLGKGGEGSLIESVTYEGYGPGGIAFIVECATDNKARTAAQIKHELEHAGGHLGGSGSVMFLFDQQGLILVSRDTLEEDKVLEKAIETGALDMETSPDGFAIYTPREDLHTIKESLLAAQFPVVSAELFFRPKTEVEADPSISGKINTLREALEELDDVQHVYTNEKEIAQA